MPGTPATAIHSHGCRLYYGSYNATNPAAAPADGVLANYTEIGNVISMNGVPMTRNAVNVSHLDSEDRADEYIPGRTKPGEITAQVNLSAARYATIFGLHSDTVNVGNDHNRYKFLIWIPYGNGLFVVARGFLSGHPVTVPDDDRVTLDVTITLSGRPARVSL